MAVAIGCNEASFLCVESTLTRLRGEKSIFIFYIKHYKYSWLRADRAWENIFLQELVAIDWLWTVFRSSTCWLMGTENFSFIYRGFLHTHVVVGDIRLCSAWWRLIYFSVSTKCVDIPSLTRKSREIGGENERSWVYCQANDGAGCRRYCGDDSGWIRGF